MKISVEELQDLDKASKSESVATLKAVIRQIVNALNIALDGLITRQV
jgi:hypothetical protein